MDKSRLRNKKVENKNALGIMFDKKKFDFEGHVSRQSELYGIKRPSEKVEIRLEHFRIKEYETIGDKLSRGIGNFARSEHDYMQRRALYGTTPSAPYQRVEQKEIKAGELFITNRRILAALDGTKVWEGFFDREMVQEIVRDRGRKNREILAKVIPKPDKPDGLYGGKLAGKIWSDTVKIAIEQGYLARVNFVVGLIEKGIVPTFAEINSTIQIKVEGKLGKDKSVLPTITLHNEAGIRKYEISGLKREEESLLEEFVKNIATKVQELSAYVLAGLEGDRATISPQFLQDWGT